MTGDMVQLPESEFDNTLKIADAMAKMGVPVYAVSGNHDRQCGDYADIIDHLWAHDVYMLENGSVRLEKKWRNHKSSWHQRPKTRRCYRRKNERHLRKYTIRTF